MENFIAFSMKYKESLLDHTEKSLFSKMIRAKNIFYGWHFFLGDIFTILSDSISNNNGLIYHINIHCWENLSTTSLNSFSLKLVIFPCLNFIFSDFFPIPDSVAQDFSSVFHTFPPSLILKLSLGSSRLSFKETGQVIVSKHLYL